MEFAVFIIGILVGMIIMGFTMVIVFYLEEKRNIPTNTLKTIQEKLEPAREALIVSPRSDASEIEDIIVAENAKKGRPTYLEELI